MHRRTLGVLTLAAGVLAACTQHQSPAAGPSPSSVAYPVTVTAANGAVRVPARPTRILSLSATATQMLYGMSAGPQVVAVDKYSTDPPNAPPRTPRPPHRSELSSCLANRGRIFRSSRGCRMRGAVSRRYRGVALRSRAGAGQVR